MSPFISELEILLAHQRMMEAKGFTPWRIATDTQVFVCQRLTLAKLAR